MNGVPWQCLINEGMHAGNRSVVLVNEAFIRAQQEVDDLKGQLDAQSRETEKYLHLLRAKKIDVEKVKNSQLKGELAEMVGSRSNGTYVKQILEYLAVDNIDDLNSKFLDMAAIATSNKGDGGPDEEVVKEAKSWAKSATKGLIDEVLKPKHIKESTVLLLGNALYFKGTWKDNFIESLTRDKDFYLLNGGK
ncbi:serpin-Z4-like, partial [Lycium barbarum]|uniref:serpin-Z4-like n=1 Tax=Lycium barbarum TaxID=112863 RepID=UPI00293EFDD4